MMVFMAFIVVPPVIRLAGLGSSVERSSNEDRLTAGQSIAKVQSFFARLEERCLLRCLTFFVLNPWCFRWYSTPPAST